MLNDLRRFHRGVHEVFVGWIERVIDLEVFREPALSVPLTLTFPVNVPALAKPLGTPGADSDAIAK